MRRLRRPPRRLLTLALLALVAVLALGALALRLTRGDDAPAQASNATVPLLAFAEFGPSGDRIYTSPANDPSERTLLDTIEHADGWGINPSPETAGSLFAFTVLPPASPGRRDAPAELWSFDLLTGNKTRIARDADLLIAPVLSRDGSALVYRASDPDGQALVVVELATGLRTVLYRERTDFGLYPIGFDADGAIVYARLSLTGTDIYRLARGAEPELLVHASDNIARDWRISPDGRLLSFLAPALTAERVVHRAHVLRLADASERALAAPAPAATEQYGPVWLPDSDTLTVGQEGTSGSGQPAALLAPDGSSRLLPAPARGFDVPLAWSASRAYLAVRSFDGVNSASPGTAGIVVIGVEDGTRILVPANAELIFIGWIGRA